MRNYRYRHLLNISKNRLFVKISKRANLILAKLPLLQFKSIFWALNTGLRSTQNKTCRQIQLKLFVQFNPIYTVLWNNRLLLERRRGWMRRSQRFSCQISGISKRLLVSLEFGIGLKIFAKSILVHLYFDHCVKTF